MISGGQSPPSIRDMQEYYRFLVSRAFLQIHNREHSNGMLVPNEDDHKKALSMTLENSRNKWGVGIALRKNKNITTIEALDSFMNSGAPNIIKEVLLNISPHAKAFNKDF